MATGIKQTKRGGITVAVDADLTQFTADMQRLQTEANAAGTKIRNVYVNVDKQIGTLANQTKQTANSFSSLGSSIGNTLGPLRMMANIIPGLGMSGILLAGYEAVKALTGGMRASTEEMDRAKQMMAAYGTNADIAYGDIVKLTNSIISMSKAQRDFELLKNTRLKTSLESDLLSTNSGNEWDVRRLYDSRINNLSYKDINKELISGKKTFEEYRDAILSAANAEDISIERAEEMISIAGRLSAVYKQNADIAKAATGDLTAPAISKTGKARGISSGGKTKYTQPQEITEALGVMRVDFEQTEAQAKEFDDLVLKVQSDLTKTPKDAEQSFINISSALDTASASLADFILTGKGGFGDMAIAITKMITQMLIFQSLKAGMSAVGLGSLFESAHGNAFSAGSGLSSYSNSIVSTPTVFPFAHGVGLMGEEAGSPGEAIMPLMRMSGGDLGVKVQGDGGGGNVYNTFEQSFTISVDGANKGGEQISEEIAKSVGSQMQRQISALVDQRLITQSRPGGLLNQGIH